MDYTDPELDLRPERPALPDTQAQPDRRGLVVDRAGIRGLRLPAHVTDVDGVARDTVATFEISARVPVVQRGTHMSRLVQAAQELAGDLQLGRLDEALDSLGDRMEERGVSIGLRFPWFIDKRAPVTQRESLLDLEVEIHARSRAILRRTSLEMTVRIPVTSLCPCSKAISRYGAHNQRSTVSVAMQLARPVAIGAVAAIVEQCASCPVYPVLKREDERFVTEAAYDNPKFAEDIVRDAVAALRRELAPRRLLVETENHESIHNHSAFAQIGDLPWKR